MLNGPIYGVVNPGFDDRASDPGSENNHQHTQGGANSYLAQYHHEASLFPARNPFNPRENRNCTSARHAAHRYLSH